jgi:hypothetical protein
MSMEMDQWLWPASVQRTYSLNYHLWVIHLTNPCAAICRDFRSAPGIYSYHSSFGRTRPKAESDGGRNG